MPLKTNKIILAVPSCVVVIGLLFLLHRERINVVKLTQNDSDSKSRNLFKEQRNEISKLLNYHRQLYGQQNCEMKALQAQSGEKVQSSVSASGGWCKQAGMSKGGHHITDRYLAVRLSIFFFDKTVASFGDGPGEYKKHIDKTGRVKKYDAYDGAPYCPETSGDRVKFLDLTVPQYGLPIYDWIMSLEVAEHIPSEFESVYIDNIVRHAAKGIVISWAPPGQGGLSHVNNRPLSYVKDMLLRKGFVHNARDSEKLSSSAHVSWLKKNINVFDRNSEFPITVDDS